MAYSYEANNDAAYIKAKKLGSRAYHAAVQRHETPYLPVLDEVAPDNLSYPHVNLGLVTIPMDRVVGTGTRGRTNAFACNFMPMLEEGSEFSGKWSRLYASVVENGVREPIKVLEYMNKYYVVEGNKRVSVLKYLGSPMMEAEVTRIIPPRTGEKENNIYFEFLDFYKDTQINYIWFSDEGGFAQLYDLTGKTPGTRWTAEEQADFRAAYTRFTEAFEVAGGDLLKITPGDAFLIYLKVYGYRKESFAVSSEIRTNLNRLRNEFRARAQEESISLLMTADGQKPGLLNKFIYSGPSKMRVAFVNHRSPEVSGWTYWHELGKNRIETVFGDKVETRMVND